MYHRGCPIEIHWNKYKFEVDEGNIYIEDESHEVISAPYYYSKDAPDSVKEAVIMKIEGLTVEKLLSLKSDIRVTLVLDQKEDAIVIPKR